MAVIEMAAGQAVTTATMKNSSKKPMMFFGGHGTGFSKAMRVVASVTAATMAWLGGPVNAFAKKPTPIKPYSRLTEKGLTQTLDAALQAKIAGKSAADAAKKNIFTQQVRPLSNKEMQAVRGRGPYRNAYFAGSPMPWHRSLRDVNLCNGSLFKSFTDIQIAPGRGAGLVLQRTYSSQDERVGPFGVGWTHAYDIRMEEAGVDPQTDAEVVPRTDFLGGKHDYKRDADGLYSPPAYLFDEMDSKYDDQLANGPSQPLEDTQKGMDGTVKHFVTNETLPDTSINHDVRVCDYIEDRHGNRTNLAYDQTITLPDGSTKKLLTSVTDPVGRSLIFTWANLGTTSQPAYRITQVDGPSGTYSVTYDYNSDLNLSAVHFDVNGLNRTMTYGYTSCGGETGLLASITDPLGHQVSYVYDVVAYVEDDETVLMPTGTVWVTQVTEPAGVDSTGTPRSLVWNIQPVAGSYGPTATVTNNAGYYLFHFTDASLRSIEEWYTTINWKTTQYDPSNNVSITSQQSEGPDGVIYRGPGKLVNRLDRYEYGPHGNILKHTTDGLPSQELTHYYDASKYFQKKTVTVKASANDPNPRITTMDYYDNQDTNVGNRGEVKWVRDMSYATTGRQSEYTYNQYGQKSSEKNLSDVVTAYTYGDTWGNLTQVVQDPSDAATSYTGLARTTSMAYDVAGRVQSSTDPKGQTSEFSYNTLGQPTITSLPAETINYSYGSNGRTNSVTDGRGTTSIAYEASSDRVASVTDPITGTVSYTYKLWGAKASVTLPDGSTTNYTYSNENLNNSFSVPMPTNNHHWNSAGPGNPYGIMGGPSGTVYGQMVFGSGPDEASPTLESITDGQGRRVEVNQTGGGGLVSHIRTNMLYDVQSQQLTQYVDVNYWYDQDWPSTHATEGKLAKQTTTLRYKDSSGWKERLLSENTYTYDGYGSRLTNTVKSSDNTVRDVEPDTIWFRYGQFPAPFPGNTRTETYSYDVLNRLTGVNYGDGETQTYTFDAMGNRTEKRDNVTGGEKYEFNAANMLTNRNVGGSSSAYISDENGNTLSGGGRVNTWDSQNRLVKVVKDGVRSEFTYGSDGLRRRSLVTKGLGEQTRTDYVLDGQSVVQEVVQQRVNSHATWGNANTISYLQGPSGPLYRHVSGTTDVSWYVYDGLGSVVGEVDVTGNLTATKDYDVYGLTRSVTGNPTSRNGFVGRLGHTEDDETGYIYMRARHYDPETGRFASEDPAKQHTNWYEYAGSNPVNAVDFDGRNWVTDVLGMIGIPTTISGLGGLALLTILRTKGLGKSVDALSAALDRIAMGLIKGGEADIKLIFALEADRVKLFELPTSAAEAGDVAIGLEQNKLAATGIGKIVAGYALKMGAVFLKMTLGEIDWNPGKM